VNEYQIVSVISLIGFLILTLGALRTHPAPNAHHGRGMGGDFRHRRSVRGRHILMAPDASIFNIICIINPTGPL
jgi:hypothetical protein